MRRMRLAMASLTCCLIVASAQAQQPPQQPPQQQPQREFRGGGAAAVPMPPADVAPPAADTPPVSTRPGFFDSVGRWFGDSKAAIDSSVRGTQETLGTLGGQAKDAAGSVVAIPGTRIITGRQLCPPASNGAPDCQQGVDALCRARGFQNGRTLDVTSAHRCSARNWIAGGAPREGPCRVETYVTRAVCQ